TSNPFGIADAACRANSRVRVRSTIVWAARVTSSVNSRVKKIGVYEIRTSAGHFSVSFTQCNSAAYLSGVKSVLNIERSCGSTVLIRFGLSDVRLLDHTANVKRRQYGNNPFVIGNKHAIPTRRQPDVIHRRHRILVAVRHADRKWNERRTRELFAEIANHQSKTRPETSRAPLPFRCRTR